MFHAIEEFVQSRDCAAHSQNPEIACQSWDCAQPILILRNTFAQSCAVCEHNGLTEWEHPNWLTEESWEFSEMAMPWMGALCWSGISLQPYPDRGEFLRVGKLPRSPWCGGLSIHARHWRWRRSCKNLLRTSLTFIYDGNLKGSIMHATEIALSQDCALVPLNLEIAHWCHSLSRLCKPSAQSQDWHPISGFWECAAQSWDCANS